MMALRKHAYLLMVFPELQLGLKIAHEQMYLAHAR